MIFPDKEEFLKLSKNFQRITIYKEIFADTLNPVGLLIQLSQYNSLFLLESANIDKTFARFSFIGINPSKIIKGIGNYVIVENKDNITKKDENIIDFILKNYPETTQYINEEFGDFAGGLVGFFGYETVNFINILRKPVKISSALHSVFFEVNRFFVFDNFKNKLYAAICVKTDKNPEIIYREALEILDEMLNSISFTISHNIQIKNNYFPTTTDYSPQTIVPEYSYNEFIEKIFLIKSEILNGEAIQIVLSEKYTIKDKIEPVSFYRALRKINPSPYMFFIKHANTVLAGSSPETHLKIKDRIAILKPIAGTYPITENREKLLNDEKEISEHLMLLDLARNDLYQGCEVNSVKVTKSFCVEDYSHVLHIVSEVKGRLLDNISPFQLFLKTFPAGTVSGAPKVRAIELIDEYEDSERGFYSGCVGYFNYNHSLDTCITIRSALIENEKTTLRAGAGIVADSIPENELNEIKRKLKAMFCAIEMSKNMEEFNVSACG